VPNVLAFKTPTVGCFLVFGVSNTKYLTFGTLDGNALTFFPKRERDCNVGQGERKRQIKNLRLKFERGGFLILFGEPTLVGIELSF